MSTPELKTRQPSGKPSWPMILLAGAEKTGKTYAAAALSASDLVDRTFWIEVGEGSADLYGALPGARYEIVEHDGSFNNLGLMTRLATEQPVEKKPHALVVDSMTAVWDMLADEQQLIANQRAARKGRGGSGDATITMDQWNAAKKRWNRLLDVLRKHNGPVILIARLEQVAVVGPDGKPTTDKTWKIRAEKNLPFEVEAVVEMPRPREAYLTGVRSLRLEVPPGAHVPYSDFTLDGLLRDMGLGELETSPRAYVATDAEAYVASLAGPEHEQLRRDAQASSGPVQRSRPKQPQSDEWSTAAPAAQPGSGVREDGPADGGPEQ
ncbi:AAA family ATPase [Streptomyces caeni]|uniref:AAA family ATPase n=1 Tax=Streptomyces caeni TaxID=2307231 RepID=A0ABW4ILB1_9ACTN